MNDLFLQAGAIGVIAAISYKSLDLAMQVVQKKFNGRSGVALSTRPEGAVVDELQKLNLQVGRFLEEQARHLELSEQTHAQAKKNAELIDRVGRDVLLLKRNGRT